MKQNIEKANNIISVNNVNFRYAGSPKSKLHLKNVSLSFGKGNWTTILGPNGSGKSTLAKVLVKINKPKSGEILFEDLPIHDLKGKVFAKKVAYIPQQIDVPHGTKVYDFISFGRNPYLGVTGTLSAEDKKIIHDTMIQTGTWEWREKSMDELSGGQRQKVLIGMIVVQNSDVIILDEPTTYLDIRNQYELLEMMHHEHMKGKTIITILHDINQAVQYSDFIYIMKEGEIHSSGLPGVVINSKSLKEVYGVDAKLYQDGDRQYLTDVKLIDFKYGTVHQHEHEHEKKSDVKVAKK